VAFRRTTKTTAGIARTMASMACQTRPRQESLELTEQELFDWGFRFEIRIDEIRYGIEEQENATRLGCPGGNSSRLTT